MKTISKKTILAGLLAVAALVPAEVGAFGFNLPSISSLSTCKNFFAMAAKWVGNGCSLTIFEPICSKRVNHSKLELGWKRSIFTPNKQPVIHGSCESKGDCLSAICASKELGADRLEFIKAFVVKEGDSFTRADFASVLDALFNSNPTFDEVRYLFLSRIELDWMGYFQSTPTQYKNLILDRCIKKAVSLDVTDRSRIIKYLKEQGAAVSVGAKLPNGMITTEYGCKQVEPIAAGSVGAKLPNGMITTEYGCKQVEPIKE